MNGRQNIEQSEPIALEHSYANALAEYLAGGGESALQGAYEIGRTALADGLGVLDMVAMHHAALASVVQRTSGTTALEQDLGRAKEFFSESLSPYEMAHRGFREAIVTLRQLNETLENEIQRIAHTVHDEAGQLLVAARLTMAGVAHDLTPSLQGRLQEVSAILDQAEKHLRRLSHELRPTILDDLGLVPAVQFLTDGISKRSGLSIGIRSSLNVRYAPNIETALYRIIQEALTNVTKHAQARNVEIQLTRVARSLHCRIRDDGIGFDVLARGGQKGLGLVGIRERLNAVGGSLHIDSEPGRGTELLVKIPLEK
jgi:signal transduction histidine kinase